MAKVQVFEAVKAANRSWIGLLKCAPGSIVVFTVAGLAIAFSETLPPAVVLIALLAMIGGYVMATGAIMRAALVEDHPGDAAFRPGPYGLQWTRQEWRVLGVNALVWSVIAMMLALEAVLWILVVAAVKAGTGQAVTPRFGLYLLPELIIFLAAPIYVATRLSLAMPASLSSQKIAMGWELTKGQAGPMFGAYVILWLEFVAATMILAIPVVLVAMATGISLTTKAGGGLVREIVQVLAQGLVALPLGLGLIAHFHRRLAPPNA